MSDTPTEMRARHLREYEAGRAILGHQYCEMADAAEKLERENAAMRERIAELEAAIPPDEPTATMVEAGAQRLVRVETGKEVWPSSWSAFDAAAARSEATRVYLSMMKAWRSP